jgi:CubicO group peptidase (beta-lactamase class C family)
VNTASELEVSELSRERFPRTREILDQGVKDAVAPGFVAGFWSHENPDRALISAAGQRRIHPSAQPMLPDTIFDLASIAKAYATAMLAAVLVDRGWLSYDAPVKAFFPEYRHSEILVSHLLSHTAGFAAWAPYWEKLRALYTPRTVESRSIAERQKQVRQWVLAETPEVGVGERALYSDISFLLLGFVLEEITQMPLDQAVRHFVWDSLGVERSYYVHITRRAKSIHDENVAATEDSSWRGGVLQGQVHDDNCWAMGGYAGHAGVFGDARDLLHFARRLFSGFLSPQTLSRMWTPVSRPSGCTRTLGWDTPAPKESLVGDKISRSAVGHWGYTGTGLWIDPHARFAVTLLSNRVHPTRENTRMKEFRPRFHDALMTDLSSG